MALTKVFKIELTGGRDVQNDVAAIKKEITNFARATKAAKAELALLLAGGGGDESAINALKKNISDLERQMRALGQQRSNLENDAKAQAQAEKLLAEALLKEAQATKALEQANLARTKSQIAQEKELDRQIAAEQKEQAALERKKRTLDALPGSYNAVRNALNQLRPLIQSGNESSSISFGGQQLSFDQAIAEYKRLSAAEQEFRRQFTRDGTLVNEYASGIVDAFKRLNIDDIIRNQVKGARDQLTTLETKSKELVVAYRQAQQAGSADLNKLEKEIHDNVVETNNLRKSIQQTEVQLKGMGGIGDQITSSLDRNFKSLKNNISQFALQFVGFQALFSGITQGIQGAKELSDQTTELEIQLGKTAGGASSLVNELAKLDTRTKLTVLEDIAAVALRAGVAEQNILGVTKAFDIMKIAFGKDFGDIETGTETIVKLIDIFFEDGEVTEERILKIGNSIRTMANEGSASVPFINDFSFRMAGLRQISKIALPDIVALGAGFQEFGLSSEVSSTVLVKLLPQIAANLNQFAKSAGISREELAKLVEENPAEALIKVSQGLTKSKGGLEAFANSLKDSGVEAGRAISVIATLGGRADDFRKKIATAGVAIQSTDAITEAFNQKNENLAATMDKIGKKFADAAGSKGFQTALLVLSSIITVLISNVGTILIPLIIAATGFTNSWAGSIIRLTAAKSLEIAALVAEKAQLIATNALRAAAAVITNIYAAATIRSATATGVAAAAYRILAGTIALLASPLGIAIGLVTALTTVFGILSVSAKSVTASLSEQARLKKINAELDKEVLKTTSAQISVLDGWIAVIKSSATSADTKRKAVAELSKINKAFDGVLKDNVFNLTLLDEAYKKVKKSIEANARAQAAASLTAKKQQRIAEISSLRQVLETRFAQRQAGVFDTEQLGQSELALLEEFKLGSAILEGNLDKVKKILNTKQKEAIEIYEDYLKVQVESENELANLEEKIRAEQEATADQVFKSFEVDIAKLKEQIEALDKQIENFQGSRADLTKLVTERKKLQDQLDALLGKEKGKDRASRLTGDQKDAFKEIDALRDRLLAEENESFLELQIGEKTYLENVYQFNVDAINRKLALIKGKNAEEKKIIADLNLEKIKQLQDVNKKLFDLDNKQIEVNLRNQRLAAQRGLDTVAATPGVSATDAITAKEDYYNRLLQAQIVFNQEQTALEKKYGIVSIENEQKRAEEIEKIIRELQEELRKLPQARLEDIRREGDLVIAAHNIQFERATRAILDNDKLSHKRRQNALEKLNRAQRRTILSDELKTLQREFNEIEDQLVSNLVSYEDYLKKKQDLEAKATQLAEETKSPIKQNIVLPGDGAIQTLLTDSLTDLANFAEGSAEEQLLGNVIAQSYNLAFEAMNAFYDGQRERIEEEKQLRLDQLDREKQRLKNTATSREEEETIERQFAEKKRKVEKEAGEKLKKVKKAEARIALATELANIAAAAAANPLNGVTLGTAGIIMYGILSALALARYAINTNAISREQFGFGGTLKRKKKYGLGGKTGEVPTKGGVFGGKSHSQGGTDFSFSGQQYNAEVGELSIIRTKNAPKNKKYSITGTHSQIASGLNQLGGGVSFANGASIRKFDTGGQLGTTLRPPTFTNGYNSAAVNASAAGNSDLAELKTMIAEVARAVYASDQKEVVLDTRKVTKQQERTRKDVDLGTI